MINAWFDALYDCRYLLVLLAVVAALAVVEMAGRHVAFYHCEVAAQNILDY